MQFIKLIGGRKMKKAIILFVASILLAVCGTTCNADEMTVGQKIDRTVVYAMAQQRSIDFASIDLGEVEKYFAQIFQSEASKIKWMGRILNRVNDQVPQDAEIFISNPEINIAPEPFIQVELKNVTYTFFKSGSISYDIGDMDPEEFFSRK